MIQRYRVEPKGDKCLVEVRGKQMTFDCTYESFQQGAAAYQKGALIQYAWPFLPDSQREFLMTGMLPCEWDAMVADLQEAE